MVFTTWSLLARTRMHTNQFFGRKVPSPDKFWKRRAVFLQTGHFFGRGRNCYVQAVRLNLRALTYVRMRRQVRKRDAVDLWDTRIEGSCNELGYNAWYMREALTRADIYLDRKVLANFSLHEPRTFRALTAIAAMKTGQPVDEGGLGMHKSGPDIPIAGNI